MYAKSTTTPENWLLKRGKQLCCNDCAGHWPRWTLLHAWSLLPDFERSSELASVPPLTSWCRFHCCTGRAQCCRLSGRVPAELQACRWCREQRRGTWGMAENWRWSPVRKHTRTVKKPVRCVQLRISLSPDQPRSDALTGTARFLWLFNGTTKTQKTQGTLPLLSPALLLYFHGLIRHAGGLKNVWRRGKALVFEGNVCLLTLASR